MRSFLEVAGPVLLVLAGIAGLALMMFASLFERGAC